MAGWPTFWTYIWWMLETFIWIAMIFFVVLVLIDVFRDHKLAAGWKVLWTILLIFIPFLSALVYVIVRGRGMAERSAQRRSGPAEDDSYRPRPSASPADDIARAQSLLESGAITQGEFDALKSKALTGNFYS